MTNSRSSTLFRSFPNHNRHRNSHDRQTQLTSPRSNVQSFPCHLETNRQTTTQHEQTSYPAPSNIPDRAAPETLQERRRIFEEIWSLWDFGVCFILPSVVFYFDIFVSLHLEELITHFTLNEQVVYSCLFPILLISQIYGVWIFVAPHLPYEDIMWNCMALYITYPCATPWSARWAAKSSQQHWRV